MASKTVYIPVTFDTEEEITDEQAMNLADTITAMLDDDFYNGDNVFDNATEFGIDMNKLKFGDSLTYSELAPRA